MNIWKAALGLFLLVQFAAVMVALARPIDDDKVAPYSIAAVTAGVLYGGLFVALVNA